MIGDRDQDMSSLNPAFENPYNRRQVDPRGLPVGFRGGPGRHEAKPENLRPMADSDRSTAPISLFYSYSHKDEALREKLETHLSLLKNQGVIRDWHDRRIEAGTE